MQRFYPHIIRESEEFKVRRDITYGARRLANYGFNRVLFFWGLYFILFGLSSQQQEKFPLFVNIPEIQFVPQGLAICFYGGLAVRLSLYLSLRRYWAVGRGFNEYDKKAQKIRIFRWGFPGKHRRLEFFYSFSDLESLCLENRSRFIESTTTELYLSIKGQQKINITQLGSKNIRLSRELECFAGELAKFLKIPLERK